jgi:hypothetical protein
MATPAREMAVEKQGTIRVEDGKHQKKKNPEN